MPPSDMMEARDAAAAWRWCWLLPAVPFVLIAVRLLRGAAVLRQFGQRIDRLHWRSLHCLRMANALHKPVLTISATSVLLRLVFFAVAVGTANRRRSSTFFWLAQVPSVGYVALVAYLVLFFLSIAHTQRWPKDLRLGVTSTGAVVVTAATAVFLAFCVLLLVEVTLLTVVRRSMLEPTAHHPHQPEDQDGDGVRPPVALLTIARYAFLYAAMLWSLLGLLLLRVQARAVRVLRGDNKTDSGSPSRAPMLPSSYIAGLSRWTTWIAVLLLLRGVYSAAIAIVCDAPGLARWFFLPASGRQWGEFWSAILLDAAWELVVLGVVLALLNTVPVAFYYRPMGSPTSSPPPSASESESDENHDEEVEEGAQLLSAPSPVLGFRFQVPTLHELVQDYVVVTRQSLAWQRGDGIYTYAHGERERCVHHCTPTEANVDAAPAGGVVGSEYLECQCQSQPMDDDTDELLSARVPLLLADNQEEAEFEVVNPFPTEVARAATVESDTRLDIEYPREE